MSKLNNYSPEVRERVARMAREHRGMPPTLWLGIGFILLFLMAGAQAADIQSEVLAKTGTSWNGAALPAYPTAAPEVTILKITIPPGARLPMHKHPVINAAYVLSGSLTVRTEAGDVRELQAGESLVEVVNTWHFGANEGTEPAVLVVFYAGAEKMPLTIIKLEGGQE